MAEKEDGTMYWNYRVIKRTDDEETFYAVHEVYYEDDDTIISCTENPIAPLFNETIDEPGHSLKKDFERQMEALEKPILNWEDMGDGS